MSDRSGPFDPADPTAEGPVQPPSSAPAGPPAPPPAASPPPGWPPPAPQVPPPVTSPPAAHPPTPPVAPGAGAYPAPGQPGYPQPGYPPAAQGPYAQPGYPQPGPGYPQPGYPQVPPGYQPPGQPGQVGYPPPGQPGAGVHPAPGQVGYPQPGYAQVPPGYPPPGATWAPPGPPPVPPRRRSKLPLVLAIVAVLALLVAGAVVMGGTDSGPVTATPDRAPTTTRQRKDRTVTTRTEDQVVTDALKEIEGFWATTYPAVYGSTYQPVSGGLYPYGPRTELPPCPGIRSYEDIAENAFYCPQADLIAWDSKKLLAPLRKEFGELTLGIVMAHEMGHAVQARAGVEGRTVTMEQQADCFAGSWVRSVSDGRSTAFKVGPGELDSALGGMLLLRDTPGIDASDPDAHGTAFDRVAALKDGFDNGVKACARYDDKLIAARLVALPFLDAADAASGGNLPFDDIEQLTVDDLEDYWSKVFTQAKLTWKPVADAIAFDPDVNVPSCGGKAGNPDDYVGVAFYCTVDDFVAWDDANLAPALYDRGGDFAVATVIASQYSAAVQQRLGLTGTPLGLSLQSDCMTGVWAASLFREERGASQTLLLSPGDLDEAILAMLNLGDPPKVVEQGKSGRGSGFQRVGAFQDGFVNGFNACDAYANR